MIYSLFLTKMYLTSLYMPFESEKLNENKAQPNPVSFFSTVPSLQNLMIDRLLNEMGTVPRLLEYILQEKEPARTVLKFTCRPRLVQHLCKLAAQDKKAETKAILELDPTLMFDELEEKEAVKNHLGEIIPGSAFRIALGAESYGLLKVMLPFIYRIENGIQIASEQYKRQFSDEQEYKSYDLYSILVAITADPCVGGKPNARTEELLQQFEEHFHSEGRVISNGKHFHLEVFGNLDKAFTRAYYHAGASRWSWDQNSVCCVRILGYLQSKLPACRALELRRGWDGMCEGGKLAIIPDDEISLDFDGIGKLGHACYISHCGTVLNPGSVEINDRMRPLGEELPDYSLGHPYFELYLVIPYFRDIRLEMEKITQPFRDSDPVPVKKSSCVLL